VKTLALFFPETKSLSLLTILTKRSAKMNMQGLPQTYKGHSTAELLNILERIPGGKAKDIPMQTMFILNDFVMEYKLTYMARWEPGQRPEQMKQSPM
jgi:hypothetical protein